MAKGLVNILLEKAVDNIIDEKVIGKIGEFKTEQELNLVRLFGRSGKVLRNIYLPKDNGETSEVDVVFITQKGIFVIESKNYSGWIFGDENSRYWTAMLPNKEQNQFYNPIMQNRTHMKWMRNFVGTDVPLFSVIVFSDRCELKKVTVVSEDIKVIKRIQVYSTVRDYWNKNPDTVDEKKIVDIYEKLKELTNVDAAVKAAHIESIQAKYKKESVKENSTLHESETVKKCPRCGSNLILRTAKKGTKAGNQFWGCSNFPNCKYIENISNQEIIQK